MRRPRWRTARWDPEAGVIYVWFDALINYITGAGFPDDPASFERWWPADLHVIGKDIARFHTIYWPAMLWSAGLEAPRRVWVHGWLLAAGGDRMSKSRGNFLDPDDFVAAFGADGARYVALREVAFDRDTEVSWDAFVRRYNADLANDFGNLVNRTVSMAGRYLDGERPAPRPASDSPSGGGLGGDAGPLRGADRGLPAPRCPGRPVGVRRGGEQTVDAEQPWVLAKLAKAGDADAAARLRDVLGDLVEACRSSVSPWRRSCRAPRRASSLSSATSIRTLRTATVVPRCSMTLPGPPRQARPGGWLRRNRCSRVSIPRPPRPPPRPPRRTDPATLP